MERLGVPALGQGGGDREASVDAAAEDIVGDPSGEAGQAVRPNRPAGFTSSTSTMMTKITVEEASG